MLIFDCNLLLSEFESIWEYLGGFHFGLAVGDRLGAQYISNFDSVFFLGFQGIVASWLDCHGWWN